MNQRGASNKILTITVPSKNQNIVMYTERYTSISNAQQININDYSTCQLTVTLHAFWLQDQIWKLTTVI